MRLPFFRSQVFKKFGLGAYYNAKACQEAISKTMAYKRKKEREESNNFSSEKNRVPDMKGKCCEKHRENREKLHREHLIGCRGVKLFFLKYVTITTVTTATVTTVILTTVTI